MHGWSYDDAFTRNLGLISPDGQQRLRNCRVAISGMGGVGGVELVTLARLGVSRFSIADPDVFEAANTNRQYGDMTSTYGRSKTEVMAQIVRDINPEADLRVFQEPLGPDNIEEFLRDADLFVDGIDFFVFDVRRLLFQTAASKGIWAITAGPIGFSTAWLVFDPNGMGFDEYFDVKDSMGQLEKLVSFQIGLAPGETQLAYDFDLSHRGVKIDAARAPCVGLACQLCAGVVAAEAVKILLNQGRVRPVPYYQQFDPFVGRLARGRLPHGNRAAVQRWKRRRLVRQLERRLDSGIDKAGQ